MAEMAEMADVTEMDAPHSWALFGGRAFGPGLRKRIQFLQSFTPRVNPTEEVSSFSPSCLVCGSVQELQSERLLDVLEIPAFGFVGQREGVALRVVAACATDAVDVGVQ